MNTKSSPLIALISILLFLAVAVTKPVDLARANPYHFRTMEEVPPDADTEPPAISILSPNNNTAYTPNVVFSFNVSVKYSGTAQGLFFWKIYYEADWQRSNITVYEYIPEKGLPAPSEFNTTIDLARIPEGNHTIIVYATEGGHYETPELGSAGFVTQIFPFKITGSSSVSFTVDATPPRVSVLSLENKTFDSPDVPLDFVVNESASHVSYVLDGQENVSIAGNTTLSGLSYGPHSVTVYANDTAENVGASQTINFNVVPPPTPSPSPSPSPTASQQPTPSPEPQSAGFPAELVYVAGAIAIIVAIAAVAVMLRKRK